MPPAARISDMHTCPMVTPGTPPVPHVGGPVVSGAPTVIIGFMPAARISDQCVCVGPPDVIVKGSPTVIICGMPAARIGDNTAHGGVIVAGFPTVIIGEAGSGSAGMVPPKMANVAQAPESQAGPLSSQSGAGGYQIAGDQAAVAPEGAGGGRRRQNRSQPERTWITAQLNDFFGDPIPNEPVRFTLDTGQVLSGNTDREGRAHFEGVEPDSGVVTFPNIPENSIDEQSAGFAPTEGGPDRSGRHGEVERAAPLEPDETTPHPIPPDHFDPMDLDRAEETP